MALIAVSGQPGCRFDELARLVAQRMAFELLTQTRLDTLLEEEFGPGATIPDKAYSDAVGSILARLATEDHLVFCAGGAEWLERRLPATLRVRVVAPENYRIGGLMLARGLERPTARRLLREMEAAESALRRRRFGRATLPAHLFDLILNAEGWDSERLAEVVAAAAAAMGLRESGLLSPAAEAQLQFQVRLRLSRHGMVPPGKARLPRKQFAHQSEQIFANLLDFYRIAWEYEPRSFPVQWDREGRVSEAFTPDFYLPEFDLYVELTTMKQSLVTKKNRKIRLVKELYPHLNVQVFYQRDIENLIFKYGLAERAQPA